MPADLFAVGSGEKQRKTRIPPLSVPFLLFALPFYHPYADHYASMTMSIQQSAEYRKSGGTAELYSQREVHATPARIWEILSDFQSYPAWNPFIRSIRGNLAEGERITGDLRPSGATGMTIRPVLLRVIPHRELRWRGHLFVPGLFDGEHVFEIRPLGDDACLFVQHEYFSGLLAPLLENMLKTDTARGFVEMNEALKARTERPGSE
jgi:hypothetical protein